MFWDLVIAANLVKFMGNEKQKEDYLCLVVGNTLRAGTRPAPTMRGEMSTTF